MFRVSREDELPVFVKVDDKNIYFEVDLGNISEIASKELYFKLLDLNTEILPVSFGINNSHSEDPRLDSSKVVKQVTSTMTKHSVYLMRLSSQWIRQKPFSKPKSTNNLTKILL